MHAIDAHLRNARQDVDALRNSGGRVLIQVPVRERIRHQAQQVNGLIVRVRFGERGRTRQIERQLACGALDCGLHVGRGVGDTFAQNELQRERCVALRAIAGDDVEAGDLQKLFFQRRGDIIGHRGGIRAGVGTGDLNYRVIDGGQIVDGELPISGEARDDHGQCQQHGHDWPANKWPGET